MNEVFDNEISYLVKFYSKKRKGGIPKKHSRIIAKLSNIKPEIKRKVLWLYMNRMKF